MAGKVKYTAAQKKAYQANLKKKLSQVGTKKGIAKKVKGAVKQVVSNLKSKAIKNTLKSFNKSKAKIGPRMTSSYNPYLPGSHIHGAAAATTCTGLQTEKIANISGTAAFSNQFGKLYLNIGNAALFPRGSVWASLFERFRFKTLRFKFASEGYLANATGAGAGKVIMVTNYDAQDAAFSDSNAAEKYIGFDKAPPYESFTHHVRGETNNARGFNALKNYIINNSANQAIPPGATNISQQDYNPGTFQLITEGNAVTTEIGELYVEYDVEFSLPKQPVYSVPGPLVAKYAGTSSTTSTFNSMTVRTGSSAQITVTFPTVNTVTITPTPALPGHIYCVQVTQDAATTISAATTVVVGANTTAVNMLSADTVSTFQTATADLSCAIIYAKSNATTDVGIINLTYVTGTVTGACPVDIQVTVLPLTLVTAVKEISEVERRVIELEHKLSRLTVLTSCETDDEHLVDEPAPPTSAKTPNRK